MSLIQESYNRYFADNTINKLLVTSTIKGNTMQIQQLPHVPATARENHSSISIRDYMAFKILDNIATLLIR